jgi:hypothetical protein
MNTHHCHGEKRSDVAIQLNHKPREAGLLMATRLSLAERSDETIPLACRGSLREPSNDNSRKY